LETAHRSIFIRLWRRKFELHSN